MHLRWLLPTLPVIILMLPSSAIAWHRGGHMAVARIAWLELQDQQALRDRAIRLLKAHPHYNVYLAAERPASASVEEWIFLRASTWSDWVRAPRAANLTKDTVRDIKVRFDKPAWHFINLPYVHPAETLQFDAAAIRREVLVPEFNFQGEPRHTLAAMKQILGVLRAGDAADGDKAVALCWLLHLVGDLHQPLHAASLIASKAQFDPPFLPPSGDRGGNKLAIKLTAEDRNATDLHAFWDALLFSDEPSFKEVEAVVATLRANEALRREKLPELQAMEFLQWADESFQAAKDAAYQDRGEMVKARSIPPTPKGVNPLAGLDAPVVSSNYQKAAAAIAARRISLAGYRLADQLRPVLKANAERH